MSHRIERFSSTLRHCLAEILMNETNNPLFKSAVITEVITDADLRRARIFVSSPLDNLDNIVTQLMKASGFIKRSLAKRMILKYVPELVFLEHIKLDPVDPLVSPNPDPEQEQNTVES